MGRGPWEKFAPQTGKPWERFRASNPPDDSAEAAQSPVTAATTGVAEGIMPFGIVGNLAGAGKTAMDAITGTRGPLAGAPLSDLADDFQQTKDKYNKEADTAQGNSPGVAMIAKAAPAIAGGLYAAKKGGEAVLDKIADSPQISDMVRQHILGRGKDIGESLGGAIGSAAGSMKGPTAAAGGGYIGKKIGGKAGSVMDEILGKILKNQVPTTGGISEAPGVAESAESVLAEIAKKKYDPFLKKVVP